MNTVRCPSCDGLFTLTVWKGHRNNCWFTRLQAEGADAILRDLDRHEAETKESMRELRERIVSASARRTEFIGELANA